MTTLDSDIPVVKTPAEVMADTKPVQMPQNTLDAGLAEPEEVTWEATQEAVVAEVADVVSEADEIVEATETAEAVEVAETIEPVETTAVAVVGDQPEQRSLMSSEDAMAHAAIAIAGGLGGSQNQYEAAMKIMRGHELGIPPAAAVENIYVVNNKTSMGAGLIGAIIKKSGQYNYRVTEHDNEHCKVLFYEKDFLDDSGWIVCGEAEFTMTDAKTAGLVKAKSPWLTYPKNMLFARALTNGARFYCPDVFHGSIYTPEELDTVAVAPPVATQQRIAGAPPAPRAVAAPQSSPSTNRAAPAPVANDLEYDRPPWHDDVKWETEECPIHFNDPSSLANATYKGQQNPVNYFKGGRMKDHAHNTGSDWCNRASVIADLKAKVEAYSAGNEEKFNNFIDTQFSDIAVVDPNDWRAGDWFAILQILENSAVVATGQDSSGDLSTDTGEQLPV